MDKKELNQIVDETDFSWIKVKRFEESSIPTTDRYIKLVAHHKKETEFLIKKCRELASIIRANQEGMTYEEYLEKYKPKNLSEI